ncbi:MAG TPA: hypothetical protein VID48_14360 [Solirubrobacteraceae bacterium]|jgi:hypothetical protein
MSATVLDLGKIAGVVVVSLGAGISVSALFAMAVWGATRAGEQGRGERSRLLAYAGLALAGIAGSLGAALYGVILLAQK